MNKYLILTIISFFLVSLNSCKKDEDHLGRKKISEILNWSYPISFDGENTGYNQNDIPAIDENDNSYFHFFSTNNDNIISLTKDGSLNWQKDFNGDIISRIAYKSNKLFFITYDENNDVSQNHFYCLNSETGETEWTKLIAHDCESFAVKDNSVILIINDNYSDNYHLTKITFDGNIQASTKIDNVTGNFSAIDIFNNDIFIMNEIGNTSLANLIKFTDEGASFSYKWNLLFSTGNGFASDESNVSADIAIDNNANTYVTTNNTLYSISNSGSINWKSNNIEVGDLSYKVNVVLSDSANILLSIYKLYKVNPLGSVMWQIDDNVDGIVIGKNKKYYISYDGLKSLNYDKSVFWYSFISTAKNIAMMHNGNLIYSYDNEIYCIKTEAEGLDESAQWPKVFYDYGNTCYKK